MADIAVQKWGNHSPVLPVVEGTPTDADFVGTPPDGTIVIGDDGGDPATFGVYVRVNGAWEVAALA